MLPQEHPERTIRTSSWPKVSSWRTQGRCDCVSTAGKEKQRLPRRSLTPSQHDSCSDRCYRQREKRLSAQRHTLYWNSDCRCNDKWTFPVQIHRSDLKLCRRWQKEGFSLKLLLMWVLAVPPRWRLKYLNNCWINCHNICTDIYVPQRMNSTDTGDLTLPLVPPWGWHFCFSVRYLSRYWVDCIKL